FPALKKTGRQQIIVHRLSNTDYDKDRVNFCTEWDCDKKSQRWSCYQLHRGFSGNHSRTGSFTADPALSEGDYWAEYTYFPGFDRGHICPSADRTFSEEANNQTFYMSNMQPQYHAFNGFDKNNNKNKGLWLRMEQQLQTWAGNLGPKDTIFVCKGGTIDDEKNIIKRIDGKLIVPKYFFTAVLRKYYINGKHEYIALGYWCDQTNSYRTNETIKQHCMSIEKLEQLTGIDFFCNLPDDIEAKVEKNYNESSWKWL
ncbi:DNA/RNA non-specific endonuclease, partial [Prevotella merdae]|uniref:DNA/RNA non-specific endonuclease n=1 Tax=Prevotella merdae TaxID=2079531 RepID=UPI003F7FDD93